MRASSLAILCIAGSLAVTSASSASDAQLPVVQTTLANGLQVLVVPVHASPVVSLGVFYRVGSRDELPWTTGVAHQVEHMMFKGTTDFLKPGDVDRLFIDNNAQTGPDSTYYYETFASGEISDALRVESDRMENAAFDPVQLAHENIVVLSELNGGDNDPQTVLDEQVEAVAVQANQYHWPVIGWKPVVQTFATRRDLVYAFYESHYAPQNAVLVVAGDVDPTDALARIHAAFDGVPQRPVSALEDVREPSQHGTRLAVVNGSGGTNWIELAYKVPGAYAADAYPLAVLDALLARGESSRLYQALVEGGLATDLFTAPNANVDPCVYTISAPLSDGVSFSKARASIERELSRTMHAAISAAELSKAKKQVVAGYVFAHDGVESLANELAAWQAFTGDWRNDARYAARINSVSAAQVRAVAAEYLRADHLTVGEYRGSGMAGGHAQARTAYPANEFGRAALAASASVAASSEATSPLRWVLPNGLVLIIQENHANPDVAIAASAAAGSAFDPEDRPGLASLTQEMLLRGTLSRSYGALQTLIDELGVTVQKRLDHSRATYDVEALAGDEPMTMALIADVMRHPAFRSAEVGDAVVQLQGDLRQTRDDPSAVAHDALMRALYPAQNPWSRPVNGTVHGLGRIKVADLRAFYRSHVGPDDSILVVVGDVSTREIRSQVVRLFGEWRRVGAPQPGPFAPPPQRRAPLTVVNSMPGEAQVQVSIGAPGVSFKSPDVEAALLMNFILGGPSFTSRYLHQIRDVEGLVYGVGSSFAQEQGGAGPWVAQFGADPRNVRRAISDALAIAAQLQRTGVTDDELAQARRLAVDDLVTGELTNTQIADELLRDETLGLGLDYARRLPQIYSAITASQIQAAARAYLHPDAAVTSIAGPTR